MNVRLVDTTLREGAQAPVRYLTHDQKVDVVRALARIGIEEIELGHAVSEPSFIDSSLSELVATAGEVAPGARRAVWCRARVEDIATAAETGADVVSFALPVSDLHLSTRLGKDRQWALDSVEALVSAAREATVAYVSIGLEDASRADRGFLTEVVVAADEAGADRVRIADTVGCLDPLATAALVGHVDAHFGGEIGVHLHDDFSMATGNAVAALASGAGWADVSLNGLGERAGIARTEGVAAWLVVHADAAYDLPAARQAAIDVAEWVGRDIPPHAPVTGRDIFACESGLHLAGLVADPTTYEPYPPEAVGASRDWRLGQGSGRAAVRALLPHTTDDLTEVTASVRRFAVRQRAAIHPAEWEMTLGHDEAAS